MIENSTPLVSIIVPVYKVEHYIANCIESIIKQTYKNWELLLIDDGSPDNSGTICDSYSNQDDRIHVIHKENGGQSSARNVGLDIMKGSFVTFLDSDDYWHECYLSHLMELLFQYNADVVHCNCIWGNSAVFPEIKKPEEILIVSGKEALYKDISDVLLWAKIYKSSLWENIRMPLGVHNEDDCTTWKICYKANRYVYTSKQLVYHTINNDGLTSQGTRKLDLSYYQSYEEKRNLFRKENEIELLRWTLFKWQKSILLGYGNAGATAEQRAYLKEKFDSISEEIKTLPRISCKWRAVFKAFDLFPFFVSKITILLKNLLRYHRFRLFTKR